MYSAPSGSSSAPKTPCQPASLACLDRHRHAEATPLAELDETFFEPSLSDVQSYHATVVSRSKRLNEAPLLTSKYRDEDKAGRDKRKADKWPTVRSSHRSQGDSAQA